MTVRSWYNPIAFVQSVIIRPRFYGAVVGARLHLCCFLGTGRTRFAHRWLGMWVGSSISFLRSG